MKSRKSVPKRVAFVHPFHTVSVLVACSQTSCGQRTNLLGVLSLTGDHVLRVPSRAYSGHQSREVPVPEVGGPGTRNAHLVIYSRIVPHPANRRLERHIAGPRNCSRPAPNRPSPAVHPPLTSRPPNQRHSPNANSAQSEPGNNSEPQPQSLAKPPSRQENKSVPLCGFAPLRDALFFSPASHLPDRPCTAIPPLRRIAIPTRPHAHPVHRLAPAFRRPACVHTPPT